MTTFCLFQSSVFEKFPRAPGGTAGAAVRPEAPPGDAPETPTCPHGRILPGQQNPDPLPYPALTRFPPTKILHPGTQLASGQPRDKKSYTQQ